MFTTPGPSTPICSLRRLPGSTGRGLGPDFTSGNLFFSRWFFLLKPKVRPQGCTGPGAELRRGSPGGRWPASWGGGPWEHCGSQHWGSARLGVRRPPLPRAAQPSRPQGSWPQLVPHVPCRHLGRFLRREALISSHVKIHLVRAYQPVPA